jgi:hypothetical protein
MPNLLILLIFLYVMLTGVMEVATAMVDLRRRKQAAANGNGNGNGNGASTNGSHDHSVAGAARQTATVHA